MKKLVFLFITASLALAISLSSFKEGLLGWQLSQSPEYYTPENLYNYINGDSDSFLAYDFKGLYVYYFEKKGKELVLEIYNMGSVLNAIGVFRSRHGITPCRFPIGLDSDIGKNQVVFIKGPYYVKLYFYEEWPGCEDEIERIAEEVERRIEGEAVLPEQFRLFPKYDMIPCSFAYYPYSYLNIAGFDAVFEVRYFKIGEEFSLFFTPQLPSSQFLNRCRKKEVGGREFLTFNLPSGRILYMLQVGEYLAGTDSIGGLRKLYVLVRRLRKLQKESSAAHQ